MTSLRIGKAIPWQTMVTFEEAINLGHTYWDHSRTSENADDDRINKLLGVAGRQLDEAWTGEEAPLDDERLLADVLDLVHVKHNSRGKLVLQTIHSATLAIPELATVLEGKTDKVTIRCAIEEGLCEWQLRGRTQDARRCLWDGVYFRADRSTAVFCGPACRTAYHRALATVEKSSAPSTDLLGMFECARCAKELPISQFSGVERWRPDDLSTPVLSCGINGTHTDSHAKEWEDVFVCIACTREHFPQYESYIVPMGDA